MAATAGFAEVPLTVGRAGYYSLHILGNHATGLTGAAEHMLQDQLSMILDSKILL